MKDPQKEKENKRHTMSHPPDHIPELDSPRQSRSPIKKEKKDRVSSSYFLLDKCIFDQQNVNNLVTNSKSIGT